MNCSLVTSALPVPWAESDEELIIQTTPSSPTSTAPSSHTSMDAYDDAYEVDIQSLYQNRPKRKRRAQLTRATRQQAEIDELDLQWQQPRLERLDAALQSGQPNHQPHQSPPPGINTRLDLSPPGDNPNLHVPDFVSPINFSQYTRTDEYRARRIQEYENWEEFLPSMFIAYMQCADLTSEWGDESKWDMDWKLCWCQEDDMTDERAVDCYDLTGEFGVEIHK